jgi:crotonobetainyl-CoA:carnitine CoA-transferase CaiB-like acyl-CoA transferase
VRFGPTVRNHLALFNRTANAERFCNHSFALDIGDIAAVKCAATRAMPYSALSDVRVVDLTHLIAGPYATRLLAGLGAEVIKVEPPWGERGRRADAAGSRADRGPLFAFLNCNKLGVTLDLRDAIGAYALKKLLSNSDLVVENFAPGTLARLDLSPDSLMREFPRLSIVSISNFGQDGPDRDAPMSDLTLNARGGWTFAVGEKDREPLTPPGSLAQYVGGIHAAIGAVQAILARDCGAGAQHVDVSLLESTVATMIYDTVTFQYTGMTRTREGKRFARGPFMLATLKCRDGYAGLHCVSELQFTALCDMMGEPALASDPRFANAMQRYLNSDDLLQICEQFFAQHEADFLYREGQRRGLPVARIPNAREVLEWEQLSARKYFETIDDPVLGQIRVPGEPLRLLGSEFSRSRPAPRLGEHNRKILIDRLGLSESHLGRMRDAATL